MILTPKKSEDGLDVEVSSNLTYFPITAWDVRVIAVLWTLFFVTSIFVILRLFSRIKILQFYSAEDYLYNVAFVSSRQPPWGKHAHLPTDPASEPCRGRYYVPISDMPGKPPADPPPGI